MPLDITSLERAKFGQASAIGSAQQNVGLRDDALAARLASVEPPSLYESTESIPQEQRFLTPEQIRSGLIQTERASGNEPVARALEQQQQMAQGGFWKDTLARAGQAIDSFNLQQDIFDAASVRNDPERAEQLRKIQKRVQEINAESANDDTSRFLGTMASVVGPMVQSVKESVLPIAGGALLGAAMGGPGGALVGAGRAFLASNFVNWSRQGGGDIYSQLKDQGINHENARVVSTAGGLIYGAIEQIASVVGRFQPSLVAPMRNYLTRNLTSSILKAGAKYGFNVAGETSEEALQEGVMRVAYNTAADMQENMAADGSPLAQLTGTEIMGSMLEAAKESVLPIMVLGGAGGAIDLQRARSTDTRIKDLEKQYQTLVPSSNEQEFQRIYEQAAQDRVNTPPTPMGEKPNTVDLYINRLNQNMSAVRQQQIAQRQQEAAVKIEQERQQSAAFQQSVDTVLQQPDLTSDNLVAQIEQLAAANNISAEADADGNITRPAWKVAVDKIYGEDAGIYGEYKARGLKEARQAFIDRVEQAAQTNPERAEEIRQDKRIRARIFDAVYAEYQSKMGDDVFKKQEFKNILKENKTLEQLLEEYLPDTEVSDAVQVRETTQIPVGEGARGGQEVGQRGEVGVPPPQAQAQVRSPEEPPEAGGAAALVTPPVTPIQPTQVKRMEVQQDGTEAEITYEKVTAKSGTQGWRKLDPQTGARVGPFLTSGKKVDELETLARGQELPRPSAPPPPAPPMTREQAGVITEELAQRQAIERAPTGVTPAVGAQQELNELDRRERQLRRIDIDQMTDAQMQELEAIAARKTEILGSTQATAEERAGLEAATRPPTPTAPVVEPEVLPAQRQPSEFDLLAQRQREQAVAVREQAVTQVAGKIRDEEIVARLQNPDEAIRNLLPSQERPEIREIQPLVQALGISQNKTEKLLRQAGYTLERGTRRITGLPTVSAERVAQEGRAVTKAGAEQAVEGVVEETPESIAEKFDNVKAAMALMLQRRSGRGNKAQLAKLEEELKGVTLNGKPIVRATAEELRDAALESLATLGREVPADVTQAITNLGIQPVRQIAAPPAQLPPTTQAFTQKEQSDFNKFSDRVDDAVTNLASPSTLRSIAKSALDKGYIDQRGYDEVLRVQRSMGTKDDTSDAFSELQSLVNSYGERFTAQPQQRFQTVSVTNNEPATKQNVNRWGLGVSQGIAGSQWTADRTASDTIGHLRVGTKSIRFVLGDAGTTPEGQRAAGFVQTANDGEYTVLIDRQTGTMSTPQHELGHIMFDSLTDGQKSALNTTLGYDISTRGGQERFVSENLESDAARNALADRIASLSVDQRSVVVRAINAVIRGLNAMLGTNIAEIGRGAPISRLTAQQLSEGLRDFSLIIRNQQPDIQRTESWNKTLKDNNLEAGLTQREMTAYHGTPNLFPPEQGFPHGRFRLDKIGTGEGSQAYGWGIYFAEKKEVSEKYKTAGIYLDDSDVAETRVDLFEGEPIDKRTDIPQEVKRSLTRIYDLINDSREISRNEPRIQKLFDTAINEESKRVESILDESGLGKNWIKENVKNLDVRFDESTFLYRLDIPDAVIPKLLDWDGEVSQEQDGLIRNKMREERGVTLPRPYDDVAKNYSGKDYYEFLERLLGSPKATSEFLSRAGIPGLKYFDQKSRQAFSFVSVQQRSADGAIRWWVKDDLGKTAAGPYNLKAGADSWIKENKTETRNYVIWDQKVLDQIALLERNGKRLDNALEQQRRFQTAPTAQVETIPYSEFEGKYKEGSTWKGLGKQFIDYHRARTNKSQTLVQSYDKWVQTGALKSSLEANSLEQAANREWADKLPKKRNEYSFMSGVRRGLRNFYQQYGMNIRTMSRSISKEQGDFVDNNIQTEVVQTFKMRAEEMVDLAMVNKDRFDSDKDRENAVKETGKFIERWKTAPDIVTDFNGLLESPQALTNGEYYQVLRYMMNDTGLRGVMNGLTVMDEDRPMTFRTKKFADSKAKMQEMRQWAEAEIAKNPDYARLSEAQNKISDMLFPEINAIYKRLFPESDWPTKDGLKKEDFYTAIHRDVNPNVSAKNRNRLVAILRDMSSLKKREEYSKKGLLITDGLDDLYASINKSANFIGNAEFTTNYRRMLAREIEREGEVQYEPTSYGKRIVELRGQDFFDNLIESIDQVEGTAYNLNNVEERFVNRLMRNIARGALTGPTTIAMQGMSFFIPLIDYNSDVIMSGYMSSARGVTRDFMMNMARNSRYGGAIMHRLAHRLPIEEAQRATYRGKISRFNKAMDRIDRIGFAGMRAVDQASVFAHGRVAWEAVQREMPAATEQEKSDAFVKKWNNLLQYQMTGDPSMKVLSHNRGGLGAVFNMFRSTVNSQYLKISESYMKTKQSGSAQDVREFYSRTSMALLSMTLYATLVRMGAESVRDFFADLFGDDEDKKRIKKTEEYEKTNRYRVVAKELINNIASQAPITSIGASALDLITEYTLLDRRDRERYASQTAASRFHPLASAIASGAKTLEAFQRSIDAEQAYEENPNTQNESRRERAWRNLYKSGFDFLRYTPASTPIPIWSNFLSIDKALFNLE